VNFIVDKILYEKYPGLKIGVLAVSGIDNKGVDKETLDLIQEWQSRIRNRHTAETIALQPEIAAWRAAYSSFGAKPKKHTSSVESLYRMTLKGIDYKHINKIVDIYNFISLKHMVPVGGDDASAVEGDIRLTIAGGGEPFRPLNAQRGEEARKGEVVYMDDREVLCRRWNWRECDKTKMRASTTDVVLVVEVLPSAGREDVGSILSDMEFRVMNGCGGEGRHAVLDADNPVFTV